MKLSSILIAATAALVSAGCNAEKAGDGNSNASAVAPVAPPQGGDWSQVVSQTAEGGFLMGNPNAAVKLVEFGSMTCPHCAEFDEAGFKPLVDNYVKTGRVSFEFRNFVRDPFDLAGSLITRCGGPERFFPLTNAMFAGQREWMDRLGKMTPEQQQTLQTLPPERQFVEIAKLAGFQQWAAQRGLPSAKTNACLTNDAEINRLVQMNGDAVSTYNVPGTPAFLINGELVENAAAWSALEPKLKEAVGG